MFRAMMRERNCYWRQAVMVIWLWKKAVVVVADKDDGGG
jgi:hypothetical protein